MRRARNICLGIDTTGNYCSVSIVDDCSILAFAVEEMSRGHAERLGLMVKEALAKASIKVSDIDKISVSSGPGSFTGLRVGLSFAKGLALPHNIPVVGISILEIWALSADPAQNENVLACADVRRNQVFWQIFTNGIAETPPQLTDIDAAKSALNMSALNKSALNVQTECVGNGAHLLGAFEEQDSYVCPARLAWIGLDRDVNTHPAIPLYHRPPDAKLPGGKSL